ncbi:MAG: hypothetical protein LUG57_02275 [Oscillospiraceae bacterium]|nr:hypothetical protein [Oscillospiraceae bacterium]
MKKRIVSILLCLCLALALVPTVPVQAATTSVITITAQPTTLTLAVGDSIEFKVEATVADGYTLYYQWQTYNTSNAQISDFADITDATKATYTAGTMMAFSHGFAYRCKLTAKTADGEVVETVYTNTAYLYLSNSTSHVHSWSSDWSSDETYHWHECIADGCNYTLNNVKDGYAAHTMALTWDDDAHWYACSVCDYTTGVAEAHTYKDPVFTWADNYSAATVTFACSGCDYSVTVDCEVKSVTTDVTCEEDGKTVYTATATFDGVEYTDEQTVTIAATGHSYGEPEWKWAEDNSTATATFTCSECGDTATVTASAEDSTITSEITTDPGCSTTGIRTYTATVEIQGETYQGTLSQVEPATGHSWGVSWKWNEDKTEATATFTCAACGAEESVTASGSDISVTQVREENCATYGQYKHTAEVTFEDEVYSDFRYVTVAAGHSYGEPEWEWAEDNSTATATFTCSVCGDTATVTASAEDSTITSEITTDPGCTTTGIRTYTATVEIQGETYQGTLNQVEPATGHSYGDTQYTWDEADGGYTCTASRTCTVCDTTETAQETVIGTQTTDPTCTTTGVMTYTAAFENCDWADEQTKTEEIAATGHSYGEPDFTWVEDYSATAAFTCSGCGDVLTVDCEVTSGTTDATCTADGYTVYTASVTYDGTAYTDKQTAADTGSATGHTWSVTGWTWAEGYSTATASFECDNCGETTTATASTADETITSAATTAATCTATGIRTYTAIVTVDGAEYKGTAEEEIPTTAHSWGEPDWEWNDDNTATATFTCATCGTTQGVAASGEGISVTQVKAETCTTTGLYKRSATVTLDGQSYSCDTEYVVIAATGHSYETTWTSDETSHWHQCSVCGDVTDQAQHIFGDWTYDYVTMTQSRSCSVCEYTETRDICTVTIVNYDGGTTIVGFSEWGETVEISPGTNTGYLFNGWTSDSDEVVFNDAASAETSFTMPQANVTITANWVECGHTNNENNTSCTEETICSQCGGTVAATGHSWGDAQYTWGEADGGYTCTASRTCTVCNDTETAQETVSGTQTTDPTCTEKGEMTYTATFDNCDWADERTRTAEIAATGHSYGEPVFAWAEDYSAAATFTCEACGATVEPECEVNSATTAASCTVAGETVYTAAVTFEGTTYTETQTVAIPASGHSWGDWETVASPTCEDEGSERRVCAVCGLTETQGLDPTGHNWATEYTIDQAATCTTDGSQSIHCQDCDAVTDSQVIPATGHVTETQNAQAATCTQDGYTGDQVCTVCGETTAQGQVIPATGHSYEETVVAPTYTEEGYTLHTCTVCGESYTTDPTPVLTLVIGETDEEEVKVVTRTSTQELTEVPETLTEVYATVEELEVVLVEELAAEVASRVSVSVSYDEENVTVHDVTLQYQINDGEWIDATEENFPATGITVTLPYPEGTDSSYDFVVAHMFTVTSETLGTVAGEVEYPAVTKTAEGLVVTLRGLSPVAIAWTEAEAAETAEATATPAAAATATTTTTAAPNTGDAAATALWLAILALSACGLTGIVVLKKKKAK